MLIEVVVVLLLLVLLLLLPLLLLLLLGGRFPSVAGPLFELGHFLLFLMSLRFSYPSMLIFFFLLSFPLRFPLSAFCVPFETKVGNPAIRTHSFV